jgi:hypothetical protein
LRDRVTDLLNCTQAATVFGSPSWRKKMRQRDAPWPPTEAPKAQQLGSRSAANAQHFAAAMSADDDTPTAHPQAAARRGRASRRQAATRRQSATLKAL